MPEAHFLVRNGSGFHGKADVQIHQMFPCRLQPLTQIAGHGRGEVAFPMPKLSTIKTCLSTVTDLTSSQIHGVGAAQALRMQSTILQSHSPGNT